MNIPQFLYVPRTNTLGTTKLIFETRQHVYWQVLDFADLPERDKFFFENEEEFKKGGAVTVNLHIKYPILLICIGVQSSSINLEQLTKLGNIASDWYAQFYLKNQKLSKPIFNRTDETNDKAKEYFKHWVWGDNLVSQQGKLYLINLEYGLSIRFDYGDAFFASFEDFQSEISDMQFLNGERPDDETVERLLIDAWNFMGIQERIEDGYSLNELDEDILYD